MKYRPDIDGLRTLAVLPVVFYHAGIAGFTGGFVGVDIFFVISGFLITSIIHRELAEGRFSVLRFYERRARRILPAFFAVILASLFAGWILLAPVDYDQMGRSILSALLFVSNMWFWRNSGGYFDGATDYLPMLHTWSLAVEEQFYIFFPLLLMLLHRIGRRLLLLSILLLVLGSLVLAAWATPRMPSASFYLLPTRIWELGVGSLLALGLLRTGAPRMLRETAGLLGLVAVLAPVFLYDSTTVFPGLAALPPVLGAAALIWAGTAGPVWASRLLSLRPMVWTGLISYSLYLWHWPIMAFVRNRTFSVELEPTWQMATVLASVLAGWASWRFVERPFRVPVRAGGMTQRRIFALSGAGMAGLGVLAGAVTLTGGMATQRFTDEQNRQIASLQRNDSAKVGCRPLQSAHGLCFFEGGGSTSGTWMLWGDSHVGSSLPAFRDMARAANKTLVVASTPSCPPLPGLQRSDLPPEANIACTKLRETALSLLRDNPPELVFLVARWPRYIEGTRLPHEGLRRTVLYEDERKIPVDLEDNPFRVRAALLQAIDLITNAGSVPVLLGSVPEYAWDVGQQTRSHVLFGTALPDDISRAEVIALQQKSLALLESSARARAIDFIPLVPSICGETCPSSGAEGAYYIDSDHLTPAGARALVLPVLKTYFSGRGAGLPETARPKNVVVRP